MTMVSEQWMPAPDGFDLYEVSDQGRVRNRESGYVLRPYEDTNQWGNVYLRVTLCRRDGIRKHFYVHRLVMLTFEPRDDAESLDVNHTKEADGTRDCRLAVLEWMTKEEHGAWTRNGDIHQPEEAPF